MHGGQHRVKAIADFYKKNGYEVIPLCIAYDSTSSFNFFKKNTIFIKRNPKRHYIENLIDDYTIGLDSIDNPKLIKFILKQPNIDIIEVEQPWLFELAKNIKSTCINAKNAKLFLSTQNVEYELKRDIIKSISSIAKNELDTIINNIKNMEIKSVLEADGVWCVTDKDISIFRSLTNRDNFLLLPNGMHRRTQNSELTNKLKTSLPEKFFLFVASAHPPNASGFINYLGECLAFLPPDAKIVLAGGVTDLLRSHADFNRFKKINDSRVIFMGYVSEEQLASLLYLAHCILIPISIGGGSNLKTAEALLANKHIISSPQGFRGYEKYKNDEDVFICENQSTFRQQMLSVYNYEPSQKQCSYEELTWDYLLLPLKEHLEQCNKVRNIPV